MRIPEIRPSVFKMQVLLTYQLYKNCTLLSCNLPAYNVVEAFYILSQRMSLWYFITKDDPLYFSRMWTKWEYRESWMVRWRNKITTKWDCRESGMVRWCNKITTKWENIESGMVQRRNKIRTKWVCRESGMVGWRNKITTKWQYRESGTVRWRNKITTKWEYRGSGIVRWRNKIMYVDIHYKLKIGCFSLPLLNWYYLASLTATRSGIHWVLDYSEMNGSFWNFVVVWLLDSSHMT